MMDLRQIDEQLHAADISGLGLPTDPGSYLLLLHLEQAAWLPIGRLGRWNFDAGYYLYVGSALGPGGLAARLRHHLSPLRRPFWHIDYLRDQAVVTAVWYRENPVRLEHTWATRMAQLPDATIPVPRFGASDCHCAAHLVYLREWPIAPACLFDKR
ncbi:MAG TPA: GIY-YIG nuclease family protein [Chloroflexota bacterium]|nr:GIY-YIG nuclease family protein [Chloroflexota bacterium]